MAADAAPCSGFMDWELETSTCHGLKLEKQLCASERRCYSLCRRKSFSAFVSSKMEGGGAEAGSPSWRCCSQTFSEHSAVHKHAARTHDAEIRQLTQAAYERWLSRLKEEEEDEEAETQRRAEREAEPLDISAWIPETGHVSEEQLQKGPGKVLLFYRYCRVEDPHVLRAWQEALCEKLHLTGKVRLATEGINGTVGGTNAAADLYIAAMLSHPLFKMEREDFKTSDGGPECFKDMRVGVYKEIVPMGMDPDVISYQLAGEHLEPEEFHEEVQALLAGGDSGRGTVLLDCRNFYESKIGQFTQCLAPSIRKFSYFPDYVDQNLDLFRDKRVLMYCTGGIRCERGSAYLRSKDVCKEVYQLKGGIHNYLERFPEGFYRGKLFVFDERFSISANEDVISDCRYCGGPWDRYQLCSTEFCRQLVLSCPACRRDGGHTACCPACQGKGRAPHGREECNCTDGRPRIPRDAEDVQRAADTGNEENPRDDGK